MGTCRGEAHALSVGDVELDRNMLKDADTSSCSNGRRYQ